MHTNFLGYESFIVCDVVTITLLRPREAYATKYKLTLPYKYASYG